MSDKDIFSVEDTESITLTSTTVQSLKDIYTCQICKKIVFNAVQTSTSTCSHRFCLPCIAPLKKECPVCHKRFTTYKRDIYTDLAVKTLFPEDIKGRPMDEKELKRQEKEYIEESLIHSTSLWSKNAQKLYLKQVKEEIQSIGDVYPLVKYLVRCNCPEPLICVRRRITKENSPNKGRYFYGCPRYGKGDKAGEPCGKYSLIKEGIVNGTPGKDAKSGFDRNRKRNRLVGQKRKRSLQSNTPKKKNMKAKNILERFFKKQSRSK